MKFNSLKFTSLICLLAVSTFFSSCKDDDGDDKVVVDISNLQGATWTFQSYDSDNEGYNIFMSAFLEGEEYTFTSDTEFTYFEPIFEVEVSGTYTVTETTLTIAKYEDEEPHVYTIEELSAKRMKLSGTETDEEDVTVNFTIIYVRD